ncbi:hypothetical protein [Hyphomonas sp. GM-8P]|uniref:hypothetical protein n=1 Tax=Hyphomonas sp. GM-8P TaxID=1280945 RepID=UPI000DBFD927|nr:hypothetical protein [Hyphomonas sp. GM-8P]RAN39602.1 hypothetical protein HY26_02470 [Hyphomonas sp. GM-8P]
MNRAGRLAAGLIFALQLAYAIVLAAGLAALPSAEAPIPDPYFTAMELLILLIAPLLVILMAALHSAVPQAEKLFSLCALVFMAMCAAVTSLVHFLILTISRDLPGNWDSVFAFRWPSVAYAADILAWDVFFALSVLSASRVFRSPGLSLWTGRVLLASGVLSLLGLLGVATGDMQVRNIGILGYAVVFPVAALMMRKMFSQQNF